METLTYIILVLVVGLYVPHLVKLVKWGRRQWRSLHPSSEMRDKFQTLAGIKKKKWNEKTQSWETEIVESSFNPSWSKPDPIMVSTGFRQGAMKEVLDDTKKSKDKAVAAAQAALEEAFSKKIPVAKHSTLPNIEGVLPDDDEKEINEEEEVEKILTELEEESLKEVVRSLKENIK